MSIFGCILDACLTHFGYLLDTKCHQKAVKNQSENLHRKKVVPGRSGPVVDSPSWGPEGPIIKEVWLLRRSDYSRIRIFGDLVIRIFGIVFGDTDIRKNVLHADPLGRRISKKMSCSHRRVSHAIFRGASQGFGWCPGYACMTCGRAVFECFCENSNSIQITYSKQNMETEAKIWEPIF